MTVTSCHCSIKRFECPRVRTVPYQSNFCLHIQYRYVHFYSTRCSPVLYECLSCSTVKVEKKFSWTIVLSQSRLSNNGLIYSTVVYVHRCVTGEISLGLFIQTFSRQFSLYVTTHALSNTPIVTVQYMPNREGTVGDKVWYSTVQYSTSLPTPTTVVLYVYCQLY